MSCIPLVLNDYELTALLHEDVPFGDLTTSALAIDTCSGSVCFSARDDMVACGTEEAARLFELCGATVQLACYSGQTAPSGTILLTATGQAHALHRAWKTAQTVIEWCAGIATEAAHLITAARQGHPTVQVAATRKNRPGQRQLSVKAIHAGGALMHRCGLSETILIFHEHRVFLQQQAPEQVLCKLRQRCPEKKIVVEVNDHDEALRWAQADVLQLEKFSPAAVAEVATACKQHNPSLVIAVAGGVHTSNAHAYAQAGASLLVTSAPYLAPPRDVQVQFTIT
jgi:molybdenum transport protein